MASRNGSRDEQRTDSFPVVGIGASAGGFDALKMFFSAAKPDANLAFIVVQHLDPDHRSMLPELLARDVVLPVQVVENGTRIAPSHIYVIPPNASLTIDDGALRLLPPTQPREQRTPIDTFFTSLAAERAEKAACVIHSGTGSDGTLGLRAIKEHGGLTLAQAGAEYDGMMRSALSTGAVDFVLPAQQMLPKLVEYFGPDGRGRKIADAAAEQAPNYLNQICAVLRARTGHDFTGYKDKTLIRRIQRRCGDDLSYTALR